jgi:pimeloyl-ACP methyl ester carboxylesterase
LLFVHGLNSDQDSYAKRAEIASVALESTCLTFDLSGHGMSEGNRSNFSSRDHRQDLVAAYDRLRAETTVDPSRIGVCASSYGAYLTCFLIADRPVWRLLLRAPALYSDHDAGNPRAKLDKNPIGHSHSALRNLQNFDGPTLVLESGADEIVPHSTIDQYMEAASNPTYHVIPEAKHALVHEKWNLAFIHEIIAWFRNLRSGYACM